MQIHSTTEEWDNQLQQCILACQPWIEKLARRFSRSSIRCEFEEFVSIGMVKVCEAAKSVTRLETAVAYMCQAARCGMIDEYRHLHCLCTVSIDAPLSSNSDDSFSLLDILPDHSFDEVSRSSSSEHIQAVYDALGRLSRQHRAAVVLRAGFPGYGAHSIKQTAHVLGYTASTVETYAKRGRRALRNDPLLCDVVMGSTALESDEKVEVRV